MEPIFVALLWALVWGLVTFFVANFFTDERTAKFAGLIVALLVFLSRAS